MNWITRFFSRRPVLQDADFDRLEYENGIWCSLPTPRRNYMVLVVADERGPIESQRQLFHKISVVLEELVYRTERYLKQHHDVSEEIGTSALGLYSIVLSGPDDPDSGDYAVELADANPVLVDAVFGVRFNDDKPLSWYIDH